MLSEFILLQRIIFFSRTAVMHDGSSVKKFTELYDLAK